MACQNGEKYIWDEDSETCTKTKLFFNNYGDILDNATVVDLMDKESCCKAGFEYALDDPDE